MTPHNHSFIGLSGHWKPDDLALTHPVSHVEVCDPESVEDRIGVGSVKTGKEIQGTIIFDAIEDPRRHRSPIACRSDNQIERQIRLFAHMARECRKSGSESIRQRLKSGL